MIKKLIDKYRCPKCGELQYLDYEEMRSGKCFYCSAKMKKYPLWLAWIIYYNDCIEKDIFLTILFVIASIVVGFCATCLTVGVIYIILSEWMITIPLIAISILIDKIAKEARK